MRTLCFALMPLISAAVLAQSVGGFGGSAFGASGVSVGDAQLSLRAEPPSSGLIRLFGGGFRGHSGPDGRSFFTRYLMDRANHIYFGYELLIEEQQPGSYLVTFGKLGLTPLEMSMDSIQRIPPNAPSNFPRPKQINWADWTMQPLPAIPEPRVVHEGDTISLEMFADSATGEKLIDDIRVQHRNVGRAFAGVSVSRLTPKAPTVPTVSGDARDFSAYDAELQLSQPLVTVNGAI